MVTKPHVTWWVETAATSFRFDACGKVVKYFVTMNTKQVAKKILRGPLLGIVLTDPAPV